MNTAGLRRSRDGWQSVTTPILASRAVRSLVYGALAVVLAEAFARRGFSPVEIGAAITAALLAGVAMIGAAALLAGTEPTIPCACLLGVVSPGGQDVGPFAAIEQAALADDQRRMNDRLSGYNLAGASAIAFGALNAAVLSYQGVLLLYGAAGIVAVLIAFSLREKSVALPARPIPAGTRYGGVERLATLFAVDASPTRSTCRMPGTGGSGPREASCSSQQRCSP